MTRSSRLIPLLLALALRLTGAEPATMQVLMESGSQPFSYLNDQGRPDGFAVDLLSAIAADQGLRVEFDLRPWQMVYADFQQGRGDVLGLVAWSEERAALMDFSLPYEKLVGGVYQRKDRPVLSTVADLAGKRVAVIKNALTHEYARHQAWQADIRPFDSFEECLRSVENGDCDVLLGMQLVTDYQIRLLKLKQVVPSELNFPEISYSLRFAVHPGQKALLAKINQGLYNLRLSREHDVLHERWLGPLEPQKLRWHDAQPFLPPVTVFFVAALAVLLWQRRLLRRVSSQARAIRENEERLQLVFEGSQDGFWDWDVTSGHILRSPRWAGMLGYTLEEIGGGRKSFLDRVHPDDLPRVLADIKLMEEGKDHYAHEFRMRAKSGEWKWILDRGKVVARDPATGNPLRITGTHTDITARKLAEETADRLEQKMQETQKLESLGVLAGGIAHDFNNLLSVVLGNASLARLEAAETPVNAARLDSIVTAANRAAELCRQLLAYAGKGRFSLTRLSLNELVTETTRLLELSISKQARLEFALAPAVPAIEGDASQLRQIIMNLVINASEALGENNPGTIRLATTVVTLPRPGALDSGPVAELAPGEYACMEISDTGCGMPPEVLARIFDPFFTTKFTGRGLGLAAVLGIVRTHQGALQVTSTAGRGSTFHIYLPVSQTQTNPPFPRTETASAAI
ncbi:transporter substrate-binding domain-containing protein [Opitutus sp. GAS368]|uniref:transporter substrate-binding domain-containing protein n=1 Tax=Opitutus sp. GAS368 TaxID=1882749 RepID=UPI000879ACB5|nr:transporter substrate-binding domain-containing protein [Opitutus sp. GAS368]SDS66616.1 PAS domain S-box-containing protein [Opitutus sp. GAS368]